MTQKIIKKLLSIGGIATEDQRRAKLETDLIRHEAKIGGEIFGPLPSGHRREFFCLDSHTWIWHEEWRDNAGKKHVRTTRYIVRPDTIVKTHDNQPYQKVSDQEALKLLDAARAYRQRVSSELYQALV